MSNNSNDRVTTFRLLAFASPTFATVLIHGPMAGILPALIIKYFGVEMAVMSTILLVSRLFDGISDPVIGFWSDRTKTPIGRRKPWIIAGTLILMVGVYRVFMPPSAAGTNYFFLWLLIITFGWTVIELPYAAWLSEITRDYNERTRIQTFRQAVALFGGLMFSVAPLMPIFASNEMTPEVLEFIGKIILFVLPLAVFASLMLNSEGKRVAIREALSIKDLILSVKANRPFQIFILMYAFYGLAVGMTYTLYFPVLDSYLNIGNKISYIMIPSTLISFIALPLWLKIISRIGKHMALMVSGLLTIAAHFTFLLIEPGPGSFIPFLILVVVETILFGAYMVAPLPILADIIDYDILKTGTNRSGQYFSVLTLLTKCNAALGGAFAYFILSLVDFDIAAKTHSPAAITGLRLAYVYIPMCFAFISCLFLWFFPIDERRQKIIRKRIETRAARKGIV